MKTKFRYRLQVMNPETKKWQNSLVTKTLKGLAKTMARNLVFNEDWYTDDNGKRLKLKLTCENKRGSKWEEVEEYTITKNWKIKGYFEWDKVDEK